MIPEERHERILAHLVGHRFLNVEQAITLLGASVATIRRDFNELAEKGLAQRTRGGLRRLDQVEDGALPYAFRAERHAEEKAAIAREAMALLGPGAVAFVDGGTTTQHMARFIPDFPITLITNSLRLATTLGEGHSQSGDLRVMLSGGALHAEAGLLVGPQCVRTLAEYRADWAFISPGGIDAEGIYNTNEDAAASERVMMYQAAKVAVLADPGKLERASMCRVTGLEAVDVVITAAGVADGTLRDTLRKTGVAVRTTGT
jgi:DeoR/GlpR family transcriptional regulator of sugar metabolism